MSSLPAFLPVLPLAPSARTRRSARPRPRPIRHPVRTAPRCSLRPHLQTLLEGHSLTTSAARDAVEYAVSGSAHAAEVGALLALLSAKGETSAELLGVVSALRERMTPVACPAPVLDIVGTGGDGLSTVNISTAACVVAAAAGCVVAKHGNRSVSSKSGSADVLEALGVATALDAGGVARCVRDARIGFMLATRFHPAMKEIAPVRKALGVRTVFNVVGPLLNPCDAQHAVVGVFAPRLLHLMADVLAARGVRRAVVVHTDGMDEFSNTGVSEVVEVVDGVKREWTFDAQRELGMPRVDVAALRGGDAQLNARIIRGVFSGDVTGPVADAIALNAGVGCYVYGLDGSIRDGVARAQEALRSGDAARTLEKWVTESQA